MPHHRWRLVNLTQVFLSSLRTIVGKAHLIAEGSATRRFRTAFRGGEGDALAVALPGSLLELWRVLGACVAENKIVIMQAANTGLTGGSTPAVRAYDRDVIVINTMRMARIFLPYGGREVVCLPGATLHQLERLLAPMGREPHSVLGSSCFGASVIGGICNNSGGALARRGPAYTEMALYAQVTETRSLRLVNHLDLGLSEEPEEALRQQWLDGRGARYPAEHNVGHLYRAPPELAEFYRSLDPTNSFNPGIGQTSVRSDWS